MRRKASLVVAMALVLGMLGGGIASAERGPRCADVIGGPGSPTYDGTTLRDVQIVLASAEPCPAVTYTLHVITDPGATEITTSTYTVTSDGTNAVLTFAPVTAPDSDDDAATTGTEPTIIEYYVTTSLGRHVVDRAPDAGNEVACYDPDPEDDVPCGSPSRNFR